MVGLSLRGALDMDALLDALGQLGEHHAPLWPGVLERRENAAASDQSVQEIDIGPLAVALTLQEPNCLRLTLATGALDATGMGEVVADLGHLYSSSLLGEPAATPGRSDARLPMSRASSLAQALPFDPALAAADLLADHHPGENAGGEYSSVVIPLGARLASDLSAFVAAKGASEYETCLAAFVLLLARFGGRPAVVVGVDPAEALVSRDRRFIGSREALDVLRIQIDFKESALSLVESVRHAMGLLIARACGECEPEGRVDDPVRVAFGFRTLLPPECVEFLGMTAVHDRAESGDERTALRLSIVEAPDATCIEWRFDATRFDARTIGHWIESYRALLGSLITEEESPVALLEMTGAEQLERLQEWNAAQYPVLPELAPLVPARFEASVDRCPDAIALRTPGVETSYRELREASHRLAHELLARGVAPRARVAIMLDPGVDRVIAHLAVFKCGAACVSLDPHWPRARRDAILASTQSVCVVSTSEAVGEPSSLPVQSLLLDEASPAIQQRSSVADPPWPAADPDDVACVLFDGQTDGASPGIVLTHRILVARVDAVSERPKIAASDVVAVVGDDAEHACPPEVLAALCRGAACFFGERPLRAAPLAWKTRLDAGDITWMRAPAAAWRALLACGWQPSARFCALVPAAELAGGLAARMLGAGVQTWHVQMLGCAVGRLSSGFLGAVDATMVGNTGAAPAARLCAGVANWVLDDRGQVCPIGVEGELYVGGACVSQRFLDSDIETAARFVPDLLGPLSGRRLFRTGRRGRWRCDERLVVFPDARETADDDVGCAVGVDGDIEVHAELPVPRSAASVAPVSGLLGSLSPSESFVPPFSGAASVEPPRAPARCRDRLAYLTVTIAGVLTGIAVMWGINHWYHDKVQRLGVPEAQEPSAVGSGAVTALDGCCEEAER